MKKLFFEIKYLITISRISNLLSHVIEQSGSNQLLMLLEVFRFIFKGQTKVPSAQTLLFFINML